MRTTKHPVSFYAHMVWESDRVTSSWNLRILIAVSQDKYLLLLYIWPPCTEINRGQHQRSSLLPLFENKKATCIYLDIMITMGRDDDDNDDAVQQETEDVFVVLAHGREPIVVHA